VKEVVKQDFLIGEKEVQSIREKYLGINQDQKKKPFKKMDKFR
jgi:hypothetical protein